jgi:hypothetical protein
MAIYMVGYDLDKPGQDYKDLIAALKKYSSWWHCLDSTWLINTNDSTPTVRDNLRQYLDTNDKLLVATISAPGAWYGFDESCSGWLLNNLK